MIVMGTMRRPRVNMMNMLTATSFTWNSMATDFNKGCGSRKSL